MVKLNSLDKDKLIDLYINEKKSLGDVARLYKVSRTAIYNKLKKYAIKQRSKSEARIEAQKQEKLPHGLFLDRKYKRFLEGFKTPSEGDAKNG